MPAEAGTPREYGGLEEIREEIDGLDRELVNLIARRARCVREAARFKRDEREVRAPARVRSMLVERRRWAEEAGLDTDLIEGLFRYLIGEFVRREAEIRASGERPRRDA